MPRTRLNDIRALSFVEPECAVVVEDAKVKQVETEGYQKSLQQGEDEGKKSHESIFRMCKQMSLLEIRIIQLEKDIS